MNQLPREKQVQVISALVEGNSINATVRMTGVSKPTVLKLIEDLGTVCWRYQDKVFRNLSCERIQCDEIWNFCYSKERNVPKDKKGRFGYGDIYTWVAICPDTKLVPTWYVGRRDMQSARAFMGDLAKRLPRRVQISTDGFSPYLQAIKENFGTNVDYGQVVKIYDVLQASREREVRYSPMNICGVKTEPLIGKPDMGRVSTSFVERQNLTLRMSMRRFTRLTNAHSKKVENLMYAIALHYMYYNFGRVNQAIRVTPAMKAGVSDHIWTIGEILALLDSHLIHSEN